MRHAEERIAQIDREIRELREARERLSKLLSTPRVLPVLVYWRYHSRYREQYDGTLRDAYRYLEQAAGDNHLAADGVEVNGIMLSMGELRERFRDEDE